mgnify:CR=1 FL=1
MLIPTNRQNLLRRVPWVGGEQKFRGLLMDLGEMSNFRCSRTASFMKTYEIICWIFKFGISNFFFRGRLLRSVPTSTESKTRSLEPFQQNADQHKVCCELLAGEKVEFWEFSFWACERHGTSSGCRSSLLTHKKKRIAAQCPYFTSFKFYVFWSLCYF